MRLLKIIYEIYESQFEEMEYNHDFKLDKDLREKICSLFAPIDSKNSTKPETPKFGEIRLMFLDNVPVYYLLYDRIGELYECIKVSTFWELAAQNDMIVTTLEGEKYVVEIWNKFYLTYEEVESSIKVGTLSEEDHNIIEKVVEEGEPIPEEKRGLTVNLFNENYYQVKFHNKEVEIIRPFKYRLFTDILASEDEEEEIIFLPPERLERMKLSYVASTIKKAVIKDNLVLRYNEESNVIEISAPEFEGRKVVLKIFGEPHYYESLPEKVYIYSDEEFKNIDLEKLAENIEIEVVDEQDN